MLGIRALSQVSNITAFVRMLCGFEVKFSLSPRISKLEPLRKLLYISTLFDSLCRGAPARP